MCLNEGFGEALPVPFIQFPPYLWWWKTITITSAKQSGPYTQWAVALWSDMKNMAKSNGPGDPDSRPQASGLIHMILPSVLSWELALDLRFFVIDFLFVLPLFIVPSLPLPSVDCVFELWRDNLPLVISAVTFCAGSVGKMPLSMTQPMSVNVLHSLHTIWKAPPLTTLVMSVGCVFLGSS